MDTLSGLPVTVTPEAAAHVAELGMQAELEQMLRHACQTIPGLRHITVELHPPYDTGDEMAVVLEVTRDLAAHKSGDHPSWAWRRWLIATFSPDVYRHFSLLFTHTNNHGR